MNTPNPVVLFRFETKALMFHLKFVIGENPIWQMLHISRHIKSKSGKLGLQVKHRVVQEEMQVVWMKGDLRAHLRVPVPVRVRVRVRWSEVERKPMMIM